MPTSLVGVFYDDGIYLSLAKSLAEGHGYRLQYLPGAPAGIHYPFGYPLFLAGLWSLWPDFPDNVVLLRGANAVLMGAFAALAFAYLSPRLKVKPWIVALCVVLATTAIPLVAVATVLFAEPLFLALTAAACWCCDAAVRVERDARQPQKALRVAIAAGVLAGAAALTRSIGVAVVAGLVLSLLYQKQRRLAVAAGIPAVVVLLPWMFFVQAHTAGVEPLLASNYGTYGAFLKQGGMAWLSLGSLAELARPLSGIALPPLPLLLKLPLGLVALAVLVLGVARLLIDAPALGFTLLCYTAIVMVWPYQPDRFLWGVLPWLAAAFVAGVHRMLTWQPVQRWRQAAGALAAASVVIGFLYYQVVVGPAGATSTQVGISATMNDILPWIRESTDSSAVIAGEDEALIWLYTGRRAVPSFLWRVNGREAESFGPDSLHAWLERSGATHMILTGPGSDAAPTIDALLARRPGYLQLVRVWPGQLMAFGIHRGT